MITLFTHTLCESAVCCWAWCACTDGEVVSQDASVLAGLHQTPHVAAYYALLSGLDWAILHGYQGITCHSRQRVVVDQVTGRCACQATHLQHLCSLVRRRLAACQGSLIWQSRQPANPAEPLAWACWEMASGARRPPTVVGDHEPNLDGGGEY